jgi:hypothetical protein
MGIGRMLAMRQPAVVLTSVWFIRKSASGAGCPGAEGEAGIFYCRRPGQPQGRIISITPKYFPYVTGDGWRTLRQLILGDARAERMVAPGLSGPCYRYSCRRWVVGAAGSSNSANRQLRLSTTASRPSISAGG